MKLVIRQMLAGSLLWALSVWSVVAAPVILNRGNGAEPYSLDPHRATMTAENNIIGDMLMGLYTEDAFGRPILGAAESVSTTPDGLVWSFKLRPHRWSDGTLVTAHDFVFAFRRVLARQTAAEYASILYPIKNAEAVNQGQLKPEKLGVSAPDARTFVIELEHPAPFLPELLTHYVSFPVPKAAVERLGSNWTRAPNMIVNGPYKLAEWRPHDKVRLVKNPNFYDAQTVVIDEVFFYPLEDDSAALKRYRAGELDIQERWPVSEFKWLNDNIPSETRRDTQLALIYVSFNMSKKPFSDLRVRQALSMAIDSETLTKTVFHGVYGAPAENFIPPGTANAERSSRVPWQAIPIEQRRIDARRLLTEAGFGPQNPLKFTYRYISVPDIKKGAIALQSMWKEIGVIVDLAASEAKVHWNLLEVRDYDVTYNTWQLDYNDAKNMFFMYLAAAVQMNTSAYANPKFEAVLRKADHEPDLQKRGVLMGQANDLLLADLPALPLVYPYQRHLVKSYVLNWKSNARDVYRTRWLKLAPRDSKRTEGDKTDEASPDFWSWISSWISLDAWDKWWNE